MSEIAFSALPVVQQIIIAVVVVLFGALSLGPFFFRIAEEVPAESLQPAAPAVEPVRPAQLTPSAS